MSIAVIVPVLGRPASAEPLVRSLEDSRADASILFVCSPDDDSDQFWEVERLSIEYGCGSFVAGFNSGRGDWARKINMMAALPHDEYDWFLLGADDLRFHPGWDKEAMKVARQTRAAVIGTNDLGNRAVMSGQLATHALVRRDYAIEQGTIDEKGKILHEGYWHNWVDAELTETAKARRQFAFARRSIVEHMHPLWKKATMDDTYRKALDQRHFEEDRRLLNQRRRLWRPGLARAERHARTRVGRRR